MHGASHRISIAGAVCDSLLRQSAFLRQVNLHLYAAYGLAAGNGADGHGLESLSGFLAGEQVDSNRIDAARAYWIFGELIVRMKAARPSLWKI